MRFGDQLLSGADSAINGFFSDADPQLAPKGQYTVDPYALLTAIPFVQVKEKVSAIEVMSAAAGYEFEQANKYKVLVGPPGRESQVFFGVEATDMCRRQCQGGICCWFPSWETQLRVVNQYGVAEEAFDLTRPWSCTCCCFGRPQVIVSESRTGKTIATLNDPFACIDLTFNIQDGNGVETIQARASGCQLGLCCPCPCGPCSTVQFDVTDAASGAPVGSITKKVPSILKFIIAPDVDNYQVDFGAVQDPRMKAALIALAIFIDFRFFSNNSNDDSRRDALSQLSGDSGSE